MPCSYSCRSSLARFLLVACLAISSTLKMAAVCSSVTLVFLCQWLNTATLSPADDVHHYINKLPVFMRQWEKEKAVLYLAEVLPP
jgi:hypothetical protein